MTSSEAMLDFTCPRCAKPSSTRFYGPCPACRDQLTAASGGPVGEVDVARFEPPMHVVANQVATKE